MKPIKMVDLRGQYDNLKIDIDQAIFSVIENTEFINGGKVREFQKELEDYLKVKHVIPCANGTDALQIALMALGLRPGDEVITSDFTFIATLEVIALLGLKPILVDVDPHTFNISTEAILRAITPRTKAIIPVHIFGQCCNMVEIMKIANDYKLFVVEDTAQAIGSVYTFNNGTRQYAGTIGDIGCTSFFPSKNLGCFGDGGALYTNSDDHAQMIRSIANHGMKVRYYHDTIGVNSRLDTIQAGILSVKLKYLDSFNAARQKAAEFYDKAFAACSKLQIPARFSDSTHIFHQYTLVLNGVNRDDLRNYLQEKGIPAMVYYPVPLHLQKAYNYLGYSENQFPVTEDLCRRVISLPMHTELGIDQLEYITSTVLEFV